MRSELDDLLATVAVNSDRITDLESRADAIDRVLARELQQQSPASSSQVDQLEDALRSSRTIGMAIGMVMQKLGVDADAAFAVLSRVSQASNRKIRDLAAEVTASGSVDGLLRQQRGR